MNDKFKAFLNQYNGMNGVGNTPENKGQCVGLISVWMDILGVAHEWGDAKDLLNNADKNVFDVILNTPDGVPQVGDVIVWRGAFNGGAGHTGVATGTGDTKTFEVFEQNDPLGSNCHLKTYKYSFVDGWLHFKQIDTQSIIDELRTARDNNWNLYQSELQKNNDLQKKLEDEQNSNITLNNTIATITSQDKDYAIQLLDSNHQRDDLKATVEATAGALGCSPDLKSQLSAINALRTPHDQVVKEVVKNIMPIADQAISNKKPQSSFVSKIIEKILFWIR